jgi:hypothetical protein
LFLRVLAFARTAAQFAHMSTLTKRHAKKPAPKRAHKLAKPALAIRSPEALKLGKPTAGFLAGTITLGPDFDPQAPAFAANEWKS